MNSELELCCDLKEIQWTLWVAKMDGPLELSEIGYKDQVFTPLSLSVNGYK